MTEAGQRIIASAKQARRMSEEDRDALINAKLGFADNLERAKHNLYLRDKFLVEKGLWSEFVAQLPKQREQS